MKKVLIKVSEGDEINYLEYEIPDIDYKKEIIEKTLNIVTLLIKQMKITSEVRMISIKMNSYKYPFSPLVTITTENDEIMLLTELVKPKYLHHEYDAFSADCNLLYSEQVDVIMEIYQKMISDFNEIDWSSICTISDDFAIKFIQP